MKTSVLNSVLRPCITAIGSIFCAFLLFGAFLNSTQAQTQRSISGAVQSPLPNGQLRGISGVRIQARLTSLSLPAQPDTTFVDTTSADGTYTFSIQVATVARRLTLRILSTDGLTFVRDTIALELPAGVSGDITGQNFVVQSYGLSGFITLASTAASLRANTTLPAGVTIALRSITDSREVLATTRATLSATDPLRAEYTFLTLTSGSYIVAPNPNLANFRPSESLVVVRDRAVNGVNFEVSPVFPLISGQILATLPDGRQQGVPNAVVSAVSQSSTDIVRTTSDANGFFAIAIATAATYNVVAQADGYVIPTRTNIFVNNQIPDAARVLTLPAQIQYYETAATLVFANLGFGLTPPAESLVRVNVETVSSRIVPNFSTRATVRLEGNTYRATFSAPQGTFRVQYAVPEVDITPLSEVPRFVVPRDVLPTLNLTPRVYTVSGLAVLLSDRRRVPVTTATFTLSSPQRRFSTTATTANPEGRFTFRVPAGQYTLSVVPPQGTRCLLSCAVSVNVSADVRTLEFQFLPDPPPLYVVRGQVLMNGQGLEQVSIAIAPTQPPSASLTQTGGGGVFEVAVTQGTLTFTPSRPGFVFQPPSRTVTIPLETGNFIGGFEATLAPVTVRGAVRTIVGVPVTNATVEIQVGQNVIGTMLVNDDGVFSTTLTNRLPGERIRLTPSGVGLKFGPPSRLLITTTATPIARIQASGVSFEDYDFRALSTTAGVTLATVTGRVVLSGGAGTPSGGLANVLISDGVRSALTGADGRFTLRDVPNGEYTLVAMRSGFRFAAPVQTVRVQNLRQLRDVNFTALGTNTTNRPPSIVRLPGNGTLEVLEGRIASGISAFYAFPMFTDADNDALVYSSVIEDPTIIRARVGRDTLVIEPLYPGTTTLAVSASDNQGGITTATLTVVVRPASQQPEIIVRRPNINTNFNASIVILPNAVRSTLAQSKALVNGSVASAGDEFGAFNSRDECVGSIVLSGGEDVLAVWGDEPETGVSGMKGNDSLRYGLVPTINRQRRRTLVLYIFGDPGPWPVGGGTIVGVRTSVAAANAAAATPPVPFATYPDPAAEQITLEYALPEPEMVRCELYTMLGEKLLTFINEPQRAGRYRAIMNVEDVPRGVYMLRLHIGQATLTRKIAILR